MAKETVASLTEKVNMLAQGMETVLGAIQQQSTPTPAIAPIAQPITPPAAQPITPPDPAHVELASAVFIGHTIDTPQGKVEDQRAGHVFFPLADGRLAYCLTRDGLAGLRQSEYDPEKGRTANQTGVKGGKVIPREVTDALRSGRVDGLLS